MKKIIKIKTQNKDYSIIIEKNSIIPFIEHKSKSKNKIFIIVDNKIKKILKQFKSDKNIKIIEIDGSEKIKSISVYSKIISTLLKNKVDRSSCLLAIGGGTIGDLAGFIASTILRGIQFNLIPTTLLSQVDSSIGGKNGINTKYGKNLVGTFLQPDTVIIDPTILKTLPKRELKSGYAEIIKHALINDLKFYNWLDKYYNKIFDLNFKYLEYAIIRSIKIKIKFVEKDEKENLINSKSRAMLNFGHTFGHALEAMNNYDNKLTHGEAISIGMICAVKISYKLGNISINEYQKIKNHFKKIQLPYYDKRINSSKIFELIKVDKKNTDENINLILLESIGNAYFKRGLNIKKIKELLT